MANAPYGNATGENRHTAKTLKSRERTGREIVVSLKDWSKDSGLAYTTIRDLVIKGEIPALKVGKHLYIRRTDGLRWIDEHAKRLG